MDRLPGEHGQGHRRKNAEKPTKIGEITHIWAVPTAAHVDYDLTMNADERPPLDLRAALQILRGRWLWVVVPLVLATALQLGLALRATPLYTASTDLLLRGKVTDALISGVNDPNAISTSNYYSSQVLATEIKVLGSDALFDKATKKLGFPAGVAAVGDPDAGILRIIAQDASPSRAAKIANVYAETYKEFRRDQTVTEIEAATTQLRKQTDVYDNEIDLYTQKIAAATETTAPAVVESYRAKRDAAQQAKDNYQSRIDGLTVDAALKSGSATVLSPAIAPSSPTSPRPLRSAATGLLAGLVAGLGLAFLREILDDRVYGPAQLAQHGYPPVLGSIPKTRSRRFKRFAKLFGRGRGSDTSPVPHEALEAYRSLRSSITFLGVDEPLKVVMVTSAKPGEGKSTTVTNLAHLMSNSGLRVLVVDCDLRSPSLHHTFGLTNDIGLSNVLAGEVGITAAAKTLRNDGDITVLTSGPTPPNAAELLGSWRAKDVFAALRPHFDMILVDGPPVLAVTDPVVISQFVDGVVLVARSRVSRRREVAAALDLLRRSNRTVSGLVVNAMPKRTWLGMGAYGTGAYAYGGYGNYGGYGSKTKRRNRIKPAPAVRTVEAWVPDDSPIWTAPLGDGWTSDHDPTQRTSPLPAADSSLESVSSLSSAGPVVQVPNDPRSLFSRFRGDKRD